MEGGRRESGKQRRAPPARPSSTPPPRGPPSERRRVANPRADVADPTSLDDDGRPARPSTSTSSRTSVAHRSGGAPAERAPRSVSSGRGRPGVDVARAPPRDVVTSSGRPTRGPGPGVAAREVVQRIGGGAGGRAVTVVPADHRPPRSRRRPPADQSRPRRGHVASPSRRLPPLDRATSQPAQRAASPRPQGVATTGRPPRGTQDRLDVEPPVTTRRRSRREAARTRGPHRDAPRRRAL